MRYDIVVFGLMLLAMTSVSQAATTATASQAQLSTIAKLVSQASHQAKDPATKQAIKEASQNIGELLYLASCSVEEVKLSLGAIQAPDAKSFDLMNNLSYLQYHPKDRCVTVKNIGNWQMPAKNALTFNVVYHSDISGETTTALVKLINDNGAWLVLEHRVRS